jgi:hypothetical protein
MYRLQVNLYSCHTGMTPHMATPGIRGEGGGPYTTAQCPPCTQIDGSTESTHRRYATCALVRSVLLTTVEAPSTVECWSSIVVARCVQDWWRSPVERQRWERSRGRMLSSLSVGIRQGKGPRPRGSGREWDRSFVRLRAIIAAQRSYGSGRAMRAGGAAR